MAIDLARILNVPSSRPVRHEYHANYHAADLLEPVGYDVEVVIKTSRNRGAQG